MFFNLNNQSLVIQAVSQTRHSNSYSVLFMVRRGVELPQEQRGRAATGDGVYKQKASGGKVHLYPVLGKAGKRCKVPRGCTSRSTDAHLAATSVGLYTENSRGAFFERTSVLAFRIIRKLFTRKKKSSLSVFFFFFKLMRSLSRN